ncbi:unnamed protein product [Rhizophagus irregularis]|nr:unnamed protein product [Rhizophagus irregularis]
MNFEIPSLNHFEESEHNLKPVHPSEEGLNPPRIDDVSSSQEKIGNLIIVCHINSGKSTLYNVLNDSKKGTKYLAVDTGVIKLTKIFGWDEPIFICY